MNPKSIIIRHPGRISAEGCQRIKEEMRLWLEDKDVPVLVLSEGMQAWILGDDGKIYDLCNSGTSIDGHFDEIKVLPTWTTAEVAEKSPL